MSLSVRRLVGLLLALTLVVGGAVQNVQSADMAAKMAVASDMPMPDGCSGCGGDNDGMPMVCSAICGSTVSAIVPEAPVLSISSLPVPVAAFAGLQIGQRGPPDPYPPRPSSMN
jgi:hypothetical protein